MSPVDFRGSICTDIRNPFPCFPGAGREAVLPESMAAIRDARYSSVTGNTVTL
jgi:hypothetical protein